MKEIINGLFIDLGQLQQFHHVDAPFAGFAFGKKSMRPVHQRRNLPLRQVRRLTGSDQPF